MFTEFNSMDEIYDYLTMPEGKVSKMTDSELEDFVLPLMASKLTDDSGNMVYVISQYLMETGTKLISTVLPILPKLYSVELSPYKFCLLCGMRGLLSLEALNEYVLANMDDVTIANVAKHPSFPLNLRNEFYIKTGKLDYVSPEAQEVFIF